MVHYSVSCLMEDGVLCALKDLTQMLLEQHVQSWDTMENLSIQKRKYNRHVSLFVISVGGELYT